MRAYVTLEVKGVVEAFAAEAAEVSLCLAVTFDVTVQHSLVLEDLLAHLQTAVEVNQAVLDVMVVLINCYGVPGTQICPAANSDFDPSIWSPWRGPVEQNWSSRQGRAGSRLVLWRWE